MSFTGCKNRKCVTCSRYDECDYRYNNYTLPGLFRWITGALIVSIGICGFLLFK